MSFDDDWYDVIVPRWYFQKTFNCCNVMLLFTVPGIS